MQPPSLAAPRVMRGFAARNSQAFIASNNHSLSVVLELSTAAASISPLASRTMLWSAANQSASIMDWLTCLSLILLKPNCLIQTLCARLSDQPQCAKVERGFLSSHLAL